MPETTKRQRNKRTKRARASSWRENPIQEITVTPNWHSSLQSDVAEFAIKILTGFLWEVKHRPDFWAEHPEMHQVERILWQLTWLEKKEEYLATEDQDLQLALIDFIRILPTMWD